MKLISNKALRDFSAKHSAAEIPLQNFRILVEKTRFTSFADLKMTFGSVDKVGERYVFNIAGNKYRLITAIAFAPQLFWVKAVLTHAEYDKGEWK